MIETTTPICPHLSRVIVTGDRPAFSLYYLDVLFSETLARFAVERNQVAVVEVGGGLGLELFVTNDCETGDICNCYPSD